MYNGAEKTSYLVTRRGVLSGGAAMITAGAALSHETTVHAAAPIAAKQAPGFYRYKVGDFEITVITDGALAFPVENFVSNATTEQVKAALAAAHRATDALSVPFSPIVVNTGSKLILIDTGLGDAAFERSKGTVGQFATNLKAAGLERSNIDAVVISHFHIDHVDGLVAADGKPAFPHAEIFVPAAEWKFWMDDGEMSRAQKGRIEGLFKNSRRVFGALGGKVTPYEAGKEVLAGLTAIATPGTPSGMRRSFCPPAPAAYSSRGTLRIFRCCSSQILVGTHRSIKTRSWPKPHAERSMTCWWPRRCWFRASITHSPLSPTSKRPRAAIARF